MVREFDIIEKPLTQAKPCIVQLMRNDGNMQWFEDAKAGQLMQIDSGGVKVYINLDYDKIRNFAGNIDYQKSHGEKKDIEATELDVSDQTKKKVKLSWNEIKEKFTFLGNSKIQNMGTKQKPIMGFVTYEKEFNALPNKPLHDSKQVSAWLDFVMKNFKDFTAQRIEALGSAVVWALGIIAVILFIVFKFGGDFFSAAEVAEASQQPVAQETKPDIAEVANNG